ncbi:hypothetical protein F4777DRAFT_591732 [Nemania sp. FL0916]|nr:hypothetical protein F4777DRAFT_591732 [Nemania sp. FL0916]
MPPKQRLYWDPDDSDDEINISMVPKLNPKAHAPYSSPAPAEEGDPVPLANTRGASGDAEPPSLSFGDRATRLGVFTPFKLVRMFPRMNGGKTTQKQGTWDFYCQSDPSNARDPLLLVPTSQFERYLDFVSSHLKLRLPIPLDESGERFAVSFREFDTPLPRFLGRAGDINQVNRLVAQAFSLPADNVDYLTPACYQMYCDKMDNIYQSLDRTAKKNNPITADEKRSKRQKECGRMIKRVQRYLGLRQAFSLMSSGSLVATNWNVLKPAPFESKETVRFVCVDVEADELAAKVITEIGLAILDTKDIAHLAPGEGGQNWFSRIKAYHLRVEEHKHVVNSKYVQGCPNSFNFGRSVIVPQQDIYKALCEIVGDQSSSDQRPIIIVGHDVRQDLNSLKLMGYNVWNVPQIVDEVDTKSMFQRMTRNKNGRGLEKVCADLGIFGQDWHNGGNDAVYTLRAMIAMAVKRTVEGSDRDKNPSAPGEDEWTDGEIDDGGSPKRSEPPVEKLNKARSKL